MKQIIKDLTSILSCLIITMLLSVMLPVSFHISLGFVAGITYYMITKGEWTDVV